MSGPTPDETYGEDAGRLIYWHVTDPAALPEGVAAAWLKRAPTKAKPKYHLLFAALPPSRRTYVAAGLGFDTAVIAAARNVGIEATCTTATSIHPPHRHQLVGTARFLSRGAATRPSPRPRAHSPPTPPREVFRRYSRRSYVHTVTRWSWGLWPSPRPRSVIQGK